MSRQIEKLFWSSWDNRNVIVSPLCEIVLFLFEYVCNDRQLKRFLTWQTLTVLFIWTLSTFGCYILFKNMKQESSPTAWPHHQCLHHVNSQEETGNRHWGSKCNPKSFSCHNDTWWQHIHAKENEQGWRCALSRSWAGDHRAPESCYHMSHRETADGLLTLRQLWPNIWNFSTRSSKWVNKATAWLAVLKTINAVTSIPRLYFILLALVWV